MIPSALMTRMSSFSYFKWHIKDIEAGGCSIGYGFNPSKGWIKRECLIHSAAKHTIKDCHVPDSDVPVEIKVCPI